MMMNFLMTAADNPATPWIILSGIAAIFLVEAWKVSHTALMGDMFADGIDD